MEGLHDKVVVFAGAGGIANATAKLLGAGGARIVVGDVVDTSAEAAVRAARDAGGDGIATVTDIADEKQVERQIDLAISTYGRIDGLFNVAAWIFVWRLLPELTGHSLEDIEKHLQDGEFSPKDFEQHPKSSPAAAGA